MSDIMVTEDQDEIAELAAHFLAEGQWDKPHGSGHIVFSDTSRIYKLAAIREIGWSMFCRVYPGDRPEYPLLSTYISPEYRRQGWGTKLVEALLIDNDLPFAFGDSNMADDFYQTLNINNQIEQEVG